jgi:methylated-DNA-[protein]-cysteine S-methyltransferase
MVSLKKRLGSSMEVGIRAISTPLGRMIVAASEEGVCRLEWSEEPENESVVGKHHVETARGWVKAFFQKRRAPVPVLDIGSLTAFQKKVLGVLPEIAPFGEVISYGDLALAAGYENSSRAVGSVMAGNPWALLVPCHRVVRRDGALGNYSGCNGPETKAWLLKHEGGKLELGI